jgi:hypothetical protein
MNSHVLPYPLSLPPINVKFHIFIFRLHLGRDFCWSPSEASEQYLDILPLFDDDRSALYSVHQLSMVSSDHRPIGTWFGPNAVAQAIKKMAAFDHHQRLNVFVALNNTLILSDVMASSTANNSVWKPLLLFVPVRLGIQEINPTYFASLKVSSVFLTTTFLHLFAKLGGARWGCLTKQEQQKVIPIGITGTFI